MMIEKRSLPSGSTNTQLSTSELLALSAGAGASLDTGALSHYESLFENDPKSKIMGTVLVKSDFTAAITSRKAAIADIQVFNVALSSESKVVTNQKSSGRCWLFATTNTIRLHMERKYGIEGFELSQSYLFFYDSLEKSNFFLEQMIDLADEPLDSRLIQHLIPQSLNNGGQWDMAVNLIEKYGLVPQSLYPESWSSSNTGHLGALLTSKLREYTLELRAIFEQSLQSLASVEGKDASEKKNVAMDRARQRKAQQMEEIYRILAITLGVPPKPSDPIVWEYYSTDKADKNATKKYNAVHTTPLELYTKYSGVNVSSQISLINDPRNPYEALYTVQRLGNVSGGRPVNYVNAEIQVLKDVAIALLKADVPVWFGCDVGKDSSNALGIMDTALFELEGAFGTSIGLSKAQRLQTGDSAMTHAMQLNAVHLDPNGKSVRWRVENSWGEAACNKGYMLMSDDWFSSHVFQIVADKSKIPKNLVKIFESGVATELPPWDPMGSLA